MGEPPRGLHHKFDVRRTDGKSAPGKKHDGCRYFVLDLDHDPYAASAINAYADACEGEHPLLSRDLRSFSVAALADDAPGIGPTDWER